MPFNITISPPQLEIFVAPGQGFTQVYNITNNDAAPITLTSSIDTWQALGTDGSVQYLSSTQASAATLVDFSLGNADLQLNQPFLIQGGQKRQLVLKVKARANAQGDSYHTLFLTQINPTTLRDTASITSGKIGSHILISVSSTEDIKYQVQVTHFASTPLFKDIFFSDITLSALIQNQSDFYFKTIGDLTITKNNREYKKFTLAPLNVAAHHERTMLCLDHDTAAPCSLSSPFWPGVYTATLTLTDTLHTPPQSYSFFVFPYYFALAVSLIALLVTVYLKHHRKI